MFVAGELKELVGLGAEAVHQLLEWTASGSMTLFRERVLAKLVEKRANT